LNCAFVNGYNVSAMQREEILQSIIEIGVVAIARVPDAEGAIHAMRAVYDGGIRAVEITMTVPGALSVLEKLADQFGDEMVLGAGTVLDPETARACMLAGAQFLVAPSLKLATIEIANRYSKVIFPGALTPTEVLTAWEAGADAIKIFPCGAVGGPKYIKAIKAPFPQIKMVAVGGVNLETTPEFLKAGACAVAVGSELIDRATVAAKRYDVIQARARQYFDAAAAVRRELRAATVHG
jgi:2-dehydro-3-deoxyphosphogluconate aldolase/(4S)-4-hydroxy-2-oxoglutarate aldolase